MTYKELLAFIDKTKTFSQDDYGFTAALRAVVELHINDGTKYWLSYSQQGVELCKHCRTEYPCQTIGTIESILKDGDD